MAKKWQELEFLDYKERQVRRRAQKKKSLLDDAGLLSGQQGVAVGADSRTQVRILVVGTALTLVLLLYVLYLRTGSGGALGQGLSIVRLSGDVTVTTTLKDWKARMGESIPKGVRVVTGADGRVELAAHVSDTRILLFERSELEFTDLRLGSSSQDFQLDCRVVRGACVFEFKNDKGIGILHARTPQDVELWGKLVYLKVMAADDQSRIIVADGFVKAEAGGEKQIIQADRQMVSTFAAPVVPPRAINVIREIWSW